MSCLDMEGFVLSSFLTSFSSEFESCQVAIHLKSSTKVYIIYIYISGYINVCRANASNMVCNCNCWEAIRIFVTNRWGEGDRLLVFILQCDMALAITCHRLFWVFEADHFALWGFAMFLNILTTLLVMSQRKNEGRDKVFMEGGWVWDQRKEVHPSEPLSDLSTGECMRKELQEVWHLNRTCFFSSIFIAQFMHHLRPMGVM